MNIFRFLVLLAATTLSSGCQTFDVKNNLVQVSRRPYIEAKVSPDYKYLGHFNFYERRPNILKTKRLLIASDSFFFIPATLNKGIAQQYVYLKIEKNHDSFFVQPFLKSSKEVLSWDLKKLGGNDFEVASYIVFPSATEDVQLQKLIEEGFMLPAGVIKVEAARVIGSNTAIRVVYGEDLALSGVWYDKWNDINSLTKEQKQFIKDVRARALSAFEILESD